MKIITSGRHDSLNERSLSVTSPDAVSGKATRLATDDRSRREVLPLPTKIDFMQLRDVLKNRFYPCRDVLQLLVFLGTQSIEKVA